MQLAILLVLVFIAVVLAPWIITVAIAAVALYGLWLVIALALSVIGAAIWLLVYTFRLRRPQQTLISTSIEAQIAEANRLHKAKEAEARASFSLEEHALREVDARRSALRKVPCHSCGGIIEKHSMFCPKCGKSPV